MKKWLAALLVLIMALAVSTFALADPGRGSEFALPSGVVVAIIVVIVLVVLAIFLHFVPMGLWISSLASGVHVSISSLVGMRIRRIQPQRLVYPLIKANKAGLNLTISQLERRTRIPPSPSASRTISFLTIWPLSGSIMSITAL